MHLFTQILHDNSPWVVTPLRTGLSHFPASLSWSHSDFHRPTWYLPSGSTFHILRALRIHSRLGWWPRILCHKGHVGRTQQKAALEQNVAVLEHRDDYNPCCSWLFGRTEKYIETIIETLGRAKCRTGHGLGHHPGSSQHYPGKWSCLSRVWAQRTEGYRALWEC